MSDNRKVKAGWLYKGPVHNEQSQGWYVPVMNDGGDLVLVDTYMISSSYSPDRNVTAMTEEIMSMGTEPHQYVIRRALYDYYYGKYGVINCPEGMVPDGYEARCYLPDWEYVSDLAARDYESDDVIHCVQLHFEHGYRWNSSLHGVTLRRRGAEKSYVRMLASAVDDAYKDMTPPHAPLCMDRVRELREKVDAMPPELEERYSHLIVRAEFIRHVEAAFMVLNDVLLNERENDQPAAFRRVHDVHDGVGTCECSECGGYVDPNDEYCRHCGVSFTQTCYGEVCE